MEHSSLGSLAAAAAAVPGLHGILGVLSEIWSLPSCLRLLAQSVHQDSQTEERAQLGTSPLAGVSGDRSCPLGCPWETSLVSPFLPPISSLSLPGSQAQVPSRLLYHFRKLIESTLNSPRAENVKGEEEQRDTGLLFTGEVKCHRHFQYPRRSTVGRCGDKGQSYCLMEVRQSLGKTPSLVPFEKLK